MNCMMQHDVMALKSDSVPELESVSGDREVALCSYISGVSHPVRHRQASTIGRKWQCAACR